jgi:hypothetical protein
MHWWNRDGHIGSMGIWWIVGTAIIAIVIWTVVRTASARGPMNSPSESPEQILQRWHAKVELERELHKRILHDLNS